MIEGEYAAEFANGGQLSFEYLRNRLDVGENTQSIRGSLRVSTERKRRERERERSREFFRSDAEF